MAVRAHDGVIDLVLLEVNSNNGHVGRQRHAQPRQPLWPKLIPGDVNDLQHLCENGK